MLLPMSLKREPRFKPPAFERNGHDLTVSRNLQLDGGVVGAAPECDGMPIMQMKGLAHSTGPFRVGRESSPEEEMCSRLI